MKNNIQRITFEEYGILLAHVISLRSEDRFIKVGCVAFDKDKKVVASGYNGFGEGQILHDDFHNNRDKRRLFTRHAEANCLSLCIKGQVEHLFLTTSPCQSCAQNIAAHKIPHVYFSNIYERDDSYKEIFTFYGIKYKIIPFESVQKYVSFLGSEVDTQPTNFIKRFWKWLKECPLFS
jgi:dCMP deaminase